MEARTHIMLMWRLNEEAEALITNYSRCWLCLFTALAAALANHGCAATMIDQAKGDRRFIVTIPGHVLEYSIPGKLIPGYGRQRSTIEFTGSARSEAQFGNDAFTKGVATFYAGVVGDFDSYDIAVQIEILKVKTPKGNVGLLRDYISETLSPPLTLKDGKRITTLGALSVDKVGGRETVVATAADMRHVARIELANGAFTTLQPYKWFFVRIDDNLALSIKFQHFEERHINTNYLEDADSMAAAIIGSAYIH